MIRDSLNKKLVVVFSSILVLVVVLSIIINSILLPKVYINNKIDSISSFYNVLDDAYKDEASHEEILTIVEEELSKNNLRVFLWDNEHKLIVDSWPLLREDEYDMGGYSATTEDKKSLQPQHHSFDRKPSFGKTESHLLNMPLEDEQIIIQEEAFSVFSFSDNTMMDEDRLCLRGSLTNGYIILLEIPVSSVEEAAGISNTLYAMVGLVVLVVGLFIVAITAKTIVKPIKELSDIAKSMEKLDFKEKYNHNRKDEIGSLGDSINSLSKKLETTINMLYEKNEALSKDNELKNRIDIMRREFISNASHELKTPIALISGYAEGLKDNVANDSDARELYSTVIIEEAAHMDYIVHQMLDLMEFESTETILEKEEIDLKEIAKSVLKDFYLILQNKQISVEIISDEDCVVQGDYLCLQKVVSNYLSNAINHVDKNKKINIFVKKYGDKVKFSVYNSGVGISEDEMDKIWEKFYKVDKARTREYGGTGLGLSIVASIISLHGGEYGVENRPEGVEFYFVLNKEINNEN